MNPIKASDLYNDDGALKKLIAELEAVQAKLKKLRDGEVSDASALEEVLKKLNATMGGHREEIEETSKQAEEIEKRYKKYTESLGENAVKIAALKNAQQKINQVNKLQAKLASSLEGSYDQLSAQYSLNKIRLNKMSAEQRKATKEGQNLEKQTREIFEEMKRLQEATGKHVLSVGDYEKSIRGLTGPFGRWIGDLENTRDELRGAIKGLKGMVGGAKALRIALIATGIGAFVVLLGTLASAFSKTKRGGELLDRVMAGIGATMGVLIDKGARLFEIVVGIFDRPLIETWEQTKETLSGVGDELVNAANKGFELEGRFQQIRDEMRDFEVQSAKTRAEIKKLNFDAENTALSPEKRKAAAKAAFELERGLQEQREDLIQREIKALEERNAISDSSAEDLQELADKQKDLADSQQASFELQTTLNNKLNTITQDGINRAKRRQEEVKRHREEVAQLASQVADANAVIGGPAAVARLEYDRAIEKIDELKAKAKSLGSDLDFSNLELIEESRLLRSLDKALGSPEELKGSVDKLKKGIVSGLKSGLETDLKAELPQPFLDGVQKAADKIQSESRSVFAEVLKDGGSIFEALGLNLDDGQLAAIGSTFSFVKGQLSSLFNFRKQIADQNVNLANTEVAEAQRALDAEIQNRNAGFAHRTATAAKELEEAKKNQKKALKEQEKAQRQQLALQSIQEAGNLVQAASKIFAQFGNPFISIPLIGTMFGFFAAAKIKAFQLSKKRFGKGTYQKLKGGSHASGNDIPLGFEVEGKQAYAEGGEDMAIFNRGAVKKYGSLLPDLVSAINRGALEERIVSMGRAASDVPINVGGASMDSSRMEGYLGELVGQGKGERYYQDTKGRMVRVRGNVKTTYL